MVGYRMLLSGPCNGLVCIAQHVSSGGAITNIVLYNPSLKQHKILPQSDLLCPADVFFRESKIFGFGYDSINNDYKVVRQHSWTWITGINHQNENIIMGGSMMIITEVFTLKTNTWRRVGFPDNAFVCDKFQCLFNGAIHRLVHNYSDSSLQLLCFDVSNETSHLFQVPNGITKLGGTCVYGDSLSIFNLVLKGNEPWCDMWVMEEYGVDNSWTLLHSIRLFSSSVDYPHGRWSILGFGMNGELIFRHPYAEKIAMWRYPHEESFENVAEFHRDPFVGFNSIGFHRVVACVESLVSLNDEEGN
ncbi:hypothetical protein COLO4_06782 [Corchorus olitorius]|uniref:F-box associated beta-propeller type 3 domain-containing protein n=1 Tax=Corchorus olitorius TaxID=93759 RepID=A0A1R3KM07_9ROSI|nr:hypothetical protein COLO4_06782 [Corchorus olitorius]